MKRHTVSRWVAVGLLLTAAISFLLLQTFSSRLASQSVAERWQGESEQPFIQSSCFFSPGAEPSIEEILIFREEVRASLKENGLEGDFLIRDAWCSTGILSVEGSRGECETDVIAIGGNFFDFHPLTLLSGNYVSQDDLMEDRVLLDDNLAWRLFGGTELTGMTITVNKIPLVIAGVVAREGDFASGKANTSETLLFMPAETFSKFKDCPISAYEIVMPEVVKGYSNGLLSSHLPDAIFKTNTERFSVPHLIQTIRNFDRLPMQTEPIAFPYWENAARCMEVWCVLLLLIIVLSVASAVLCLIPTMIFLISNGFSAISRRIRRMRRKRRSHRRSKRHYTVEVRHQPKSSSVKMRVNKQNRNRGAHCKKHRDGSDRNKYKPRNSLAPLSKV